MKIINPRFVAPVDAQAPHVKHRVAVLAVLDALPADQAGVSFKEVRTAVGKGRAALPNGAIAQIAADAGYKVDGDPGGEEE